MRKILSQGDMDGACFLYAVCNAYHALSGRKATAKRWRESLKWIPFANDFISDGGTWRYDEDVALYEFSISRILRELAPDMTFRLECVPKIKKPSEFAELIDSSSVVLTNIESEH
ncbi:hypothetical protein GCM10011502_30130 [Oceanisphaera marina]|uniref:OTU domain-containing protein n=1 Tax=Oceanisphaera marina TaxID=2017550 RepID=A0ABQ1IXN3_9GAMM|nr:hypothetical protein GCM10011502_30130 [Oceanisphaera marina]